MWPKDFLACKWCDNDKRTFVRSKFGVSSVVALMGLDGEIALNAPLDAVPTPWAAADDACHVEKWIMREYD